MLTSSEVKRSGRRPLGLACCVPDPKRPAAMANSASGSAFHFLTNHTGRNPSSPGSQPAPSYTLSISTSFVEAPLSRRCCQWAGPPYNRPQCVVFRICTSSPVTGRAARTVLRLKPSFCLLLRHFCLILRRHHHPRWVLRSPHPRKRYFCPRTKFLFGPSASAGALYCRLSRGQAEAV